MDYGSNPKLPGSHFSIRQVILTVQYIGIDMPEEEQRGDSWWLWCHTCYWHCTIAANEDFGEKLERDVVDSPEAVLSLLFVLLTITGLGWKGAWLGTSAYCMLHTWFLVCDHTACWAHCSRYKGMFLDYWFIQCFTPLQVPWKPTTFFLSGGESMTAARLRGWEGKWDKCSQEQ